MKIVAETTSAQPVRKPRPGWITRPTQEMVISDRDAEHRDPAVQQRGRGPEADGTNDRGRGGGDRVRGRAASHGHDDRVEEMQRSLVQLVLVVLVQVGLLSVMLLLTNRRVH
jgi:hypothetical protein